MRHFSRISPVLQKNQGRNQEVGDIIRPSRYTDLESSFRKSYNNGEGTTVLWRLKRTKAPNCVSNSRNVKGPTVDLRGYITTFLLTLPVLRTGRGCHRLKTKQNHLLGPVLTQKKGRRRRLLNTDHRYIPQPSSKKYERDHHRFKRI